MTKLILIRAAQTDWQAQGRLAGDTDLQLNQLGHRQAVADARAIAEDSPEAVYCGADQATKQTAMLIAEALHLRSRTLDELREMDLGHWEGLTVSAFRERFSKVYRQWRSDPLSVEPPEGESVAEVASRLEKALDKILKPDGEETIVLVLGRFAFAVACSRLAETSYERFWEHVDGEESRRVLMLDRSSTANASRSGGSPGT